MKGTRTIVRGVVFTHFVAGLSMWATTDLALAQAGRNGECHSNCPTAKPRNDGSQKIPPVNLKSANEMTDEELEQTERTLDGLSNDNVETFRNRMNNAAQGPRPVPRTDPYDCADLKDEVEQNCYAEKRRGGLGYAQCINSHARDLKKCGIKN